MSRMLVNGIHLNVEVVGSGQPLLALHGFTGDMSIWERFAHEAKHKYTIILVDLLGHGASDCPDDPERYRVERCAADLAAVLDALGVRRACWMGYSMGGRIALVASVLFPQRCASLVLEGASTGLADPAERSRRAKSDEALARFIEEKGVEHFVDYWERLPLFASQARLPAEVRLRLRMQRLRNSPRGLANALRKAGSGVQPVVEEHLSRLNMPVLCIAGEEDTKFKSIAEAMCRGLPQGRMEVIPGAGHAAHLEQPEAFSRAVLEFLRRLPPWDTPPFARVSRLDHQETIPR